VASDDIERLTERVDRLSFVLREAIVELEKHIDEVEFRFHLLKNEDGPESGIGISTNPLTE